jgi:hypothetical protein
MGEVWRGARCLLLVLGRGLMELGGVISSSRGLGGRKRCRRNLRRGIGYNGGSEAVVHEIESAIDSEESDAHSRAGSASQG